MATYYNPYFDSKTNDILAAYKKKSEEFDKKFERWLSGMDDKLRRLQASNPHPVKEAIDDHTPSKFPQIHSSVVGPESESDVVVESVEPASAEIDLASVDVTDKSDSAIATDVFEDGDLCVNVSTIETEEEEMIEVVVPEDSDDDMETAAVIVDKQNDDGINSDLYHVSTLVESAVVGVTTREVTSNMFALNRCFCVLKDAEIREWSFKTQFHAIDGALPSCLLTICENDPVRLLSICVSKLAFGGNWYSLQPFVAAAVSAEPPDKPPDKSIRTLPLLDSCLISKLLGTSISVSKPEALCDIFSWPWRELVSLPLFIPSSQLQSGHLQLFSSRLEDSSAGSISKDFHSNDGTGANCCSRCIGRDTFANAAAKVGPAVVNLSVPQGFRGLASGKSIGSGTIIGSDGTILTCAHVVVDFQGMHPSSKGKVDVTLQDGRTFEGTVENADLHSDIAIVKIKSRTPLPTAKLGSSQKLRPGDWVIAMGCPLSLQNTITAGIVSCVDRKISDLGLGGMRREYLQTDCAINAGNSGGPLVNVDGEVIGVNIMKVYAADGLGFSVPIDSVSKIIEQFKKRGRVIRPWLGLRMVDLNEMIIAQLKEKDPTFPDLDRGVLIPMVTPRSPADRAGFRPGDCVIEFDGHPVGSIKEVIDIMGDRIGVPLKVIVKRTNNALATLIVIPEEANSDM